MVKSIGFSLLVLILLPMVVSGEERVSPPYTVLVMLEYQSPFVDDGRSSFADFAFSVTFENVRFYFDNRQSLPMSAFRIDGAKGKGILSRWALNKVETGGKIVFPKMIREPQRKFEAWLKIVPGPFRKEWGENLNMLSPLPLQFRTSWGKEMMKWDYVVGTSYLEEVGIEAFLVDWEELWHGHPVSVSLPFEGSFPEEKGNWLLEFIPQVK